MIELRNVTMTYEGEDAAPVLDGVDLRVEPGEVVLLCGESGCGKTSLLRLVNGVARYFFQAQVSGEVVLGGEVITYRDAYDIAETVGSVFQNPKSQFFTLDVRSELAFGCENLGVPPAEIIRRIADVERDFGMEGLGSRSLLALSGGEKQKVACAAVAAMEPQVLLLDEPSSNLDVGAVEELRRIVSRWKEQGKTILIAEHRLYYLAGLVDRVVYLRAGRVAAEFTGEEFRALEDAELHGMGLRSTRPVPETKGGRGPNAGELVLESFSFRYPGMPRPALSIERLELPRGQIIGVVGKNGAGKSTFVRSLTGLEPKVKGILHYQERAYRKPRERLKHSYLVMQDVNHQLFGESIDSDLVMGAERSQRGRESEITELLSALNLLEKRDRHPMSLSGGERQRVAIAGALVSGREVIVFDEPTSGLDYRHMRQVAQELEKLTNQGRTVFVVTHDVELLAQCCDFLLHISDGKVELASRCEAGVLREVMGFLMGTL